MMIFVDFKLGNIRCMFGSSLSNQQEGGRDDLDGNLDHEIRKRGGFGGAKGRGGGEVDDDDDDDNDSVEKAAGAHNTRPGGRPCRCLPFGKDSINPEKNQISGEAEEAGRAGRVPISLSYLLPTTSSLASVCD